jgi:hypothetical protein
MNRLHQSSSKNQYPVVDLFISFVARFTISKYTPVFDERSSEGHD